MMWVFAIVVVLVMGAVAAVAAGKGTPMADVPADRPDPVLPAEGPVTAEDLRRVRFSLAFRGYRMAEVDALLHRLAAEREAAPAADAQPQPVTETHPATDPGTDPGTDPATDPATDPGTHTGAGAGPAVAEAADHEVRDGRSEA